jgi:hypothetical protein
VEASLLFGNGINRLSTSNISWEALLQEIKGPRPFEDDQLPNTMIYERIILEAPPKWKELLNDEYETKIRIAAILDRMAPNELYTRLLDMKFRHYLTTNYDNAFLYTNIFSDKVIRPVSGDNSESIYSIRRSKKFRTTRQQEKTLWQIHGEIGKPATLMLGLDHYCGAIGKVDAYLKGRYSYNIGGADVVEKSITDKLSDNSFSGSSWIETFFSTDLHILGLGLDFSEIDLWWMLNKRARLKRSKDFGQLIKNEIVYYCIGLDHQLEGVLSALGVTIRKFGPLSGSKKFERFYSNVLEVLEKEVGST